MYREHIQTTMYRYFLSPMVRVILISGMTKGSVCLTLRTNLNTSKLVQELKIHLRLVTYSLTTRFAR